MFAGEHDTGSPGRCPHCGYDQRGLSAGSRCPECGQVFWGGRVLGEVNRWADRVLLHLWSIAVLTAVGASSLAASTVAFGWRHPGGFMLGTAGGLYLIAAGTWYVVTLIVYVRRRTSPGYLNMADRPRRMLARWVAIDAVLVGSGVLVVIGAA